MALPQMTVGEEFSKDGMDITLLDVKGEIVCDRAGNEPDYQLADTEGLRAALGCPMQALDGEVAATVIPLLTAAEKKLSSRRQIISVSDEVAWKEAQDAHETIKEILAWAIAFPKAVLDIC